MGMVFFSPDAPTSMKEVDYGEGEVVLEKVSCLPEVEVGQATARALLDLLGLPWDAWGGELAGDELSGAIERTLRVINGDGVRHATVDASVTVGGMRAMSVQGGVTTIGRGATVVDMGVSEEKLRRRLGELLELFTQARRGGYKVCWG